MQKNLPLEDAYARIFIRIWLDFAAWIQFLLKGKPAFTLAISKAHFHFFRDIRRNAQKRTKIQVPYLNHTGVYKSSIVYSFFIDKIKVFSQLRW
jgi:hypothetical protein